MTNYDKLIEKLKEVETIKNDIEYLSDGCICNLYKSDGEKILEYNGYIVSQTRNNDILFYDKDTSEIYRITFDYQTIDENKLQKFYKKNEDLTYLDFLEQVEKVDLAETDKLHLEVIGHPLEERMIFNYCKIKGIELNKIFDFIYNNMDLNKNINNQSEYFYLGILNILN